MSAGREQMTEKAQITDAEWRAFQSIPDQGYSHRAWLDNLIRERMAEAWRAGWYARHEGKSVLHHNPHRPHVCPPGQQSGGDQ